MRCFYERTVGACAPGTYRVHDRRGCIVVCAMHAHWRDTTSQMPGHSQDCPEKDLTAATPFTHVTLIVPEV
jgi:hypothetical protein